MSRRRLWHVVAFIVLLAGPAQAGPEAADRVRALFEQAFNAADWSRLVTLFTPNAHLFDSGQDELIVGTHALRAYFSRLPRGLKIKMSEHAATQLEPTVLLSSGYIVATRTNGTENFFKVTMVLHNVDGYWLVAQYHASPSAGQNGAQYARAAPLSYAQAALASPTVRRIARTVDSGAESVIARTTFWNNECNARPVTVTIKQPPANGTASIKEGLNPVVENPRFVTGGACVARQIMGKQIIYRSNPGFHGGDVVVYEVVSDKESEAR